MLTFKLILEFKLDELSATLLLAAMMRVDNETVSLAKRLLNINAVSEIFTFRLTLERRLLAESNIAERISPALSSRAMRMPSEESNNASRMAEAESNNTVRI